MIELRVGWIDNRANLIINYVVVDQFYGYLIIGKELIPALNPVNKRILDVVKLSLKLIECSRFDLPEVAGHVSRIRILFIHVN